MGLVGGGLLLVVVIPTIVCLVLKWKARNLSTNAESNPNTSIEGEEANIDNIITSTNAAYQKTIIANTEIKVIINPVERTTKLQQSTENWDSKLNMEQNVAYELSATAPVSFYRSNITYCMSRKPPEDNDHTDDQYDNI